MPQSAAASNGSEAYSLAMILTAALPNSLQYKIMATDINQHVINQAKQGLYDRYALQKVSPAAEEQFFTPKEKIVIQISADLKQHIHFSTHNLLEESRGELMDDHDPERLIYFDAESEKRHLKTFALDCDPEGFYSLAVAEKSLSSTSDQFRVVAPAIYQYRGNA